MIEVQCLLLSLLSSSSSFGTVDGSGAVSILIAATVVVAVVVGESFASASAGGCSSCIDSSGS